MSQKTFDDKEDEFVKSLNLTDEKIKEDLEKMRDIDGFPLGDIENILEISEPPYYTAYPNPYIKEFIDYFGSPYDEKTDNYDIEPFVGDVTEGKNDPVYMAHAYHTKVPYKAIIKFIKHYTKPGDLVFDGFCGTGMTGVASQLSNRVPILSDISTMASFISNSYNKNFHYYSEIDKIIEELRNEWGWMYQTKHDAKNFGIINYIIWSDILICPYCGNEIIFWDVAVSDAKKVEKVFSCDKCNAELKKNKCKSLKVMQNINGHEITVTKEIPVLINYTYKNKRYEKKPDEYDFKLIDKIDNMMIPYWYPTEELPLGYNTEQPRKSHGLNYVNQFYNKRTLFLLSAFYDKIRNLENFTNYFIYFSSILQRASKLFRWSKNQAGPLSGTLYVAALRFETSVFNLLKNKYKMMEILQENSLFYKSNYLITNQSSTNLSKFPENSIDYIFVDPPFGSNLMYSELNFIWESWLKVFTNNEKESIINSKQNKFVDDYENLMIESFTQMFNILKPNRWITVEFHNSKAEIWDIIRKSITRSGFIIAQVAILDKKQGSFKQVNAPGSVKNDLVINAYKPASNFSKSFLDSYGVNLESEFLELHLTKLPINQNIERTEQMLYSKYLAQYLQNDFEVRLDSIDFQKLLKNNFIERDGFWFTASQAVEYDEIKLKEDKFNKIDINQTILGISDEKTALIWLTQFLREPKEYDEIHNEYLQKLMISQDKIPELKELLSENFVSEDGKYKLPSNIEQNKIKDIRIKKLEKDFKNLMDEILKSKSKIKEVRKEALIHGLTELYKEKDVDTIKLFGERIDKKIIESDDDISAIIDWARFK